MNALHSNPLNRPSGENNAKTSAGEKRTGSVGPGPADMGTSANAGPATHINDTVKPMHRVIDIDIHFSIRPEFVDRSPAKTGLASRPFTPGTKSSWRPHPASVDIHLAEDDLRHIDEATAAVTIEGKRHPAALSGYPGL